MNAVAKIKSPPPTATVGDRIVLEQLLDRIVRDEAMLDKAWTAVAPYLSKPKLENLPAFEKLLDGWKNSGASNAVGRAKAQMSLCDNERYSDDNGDPRRGEVSKALAALLGSFPTANVPDPAVFTWALLEDVAAQRPCWFELESACRIIRRTKTFMPSISEVLKILADETSKWDRRFQALDMIEFFVEEADEEVAKLKSGEAA